MCFSLVSFLSQKYSIRGEIKKTFGFLIDNIVGECRGGVG